MTIHFREAEERDLPEILAISNEQFGSSYLSREELIGLLNDPSAKIPIVLVDQQIAGYSILLTLDAQQFLRRMKVGPKGIFDQFKATDRFQVRKSTALSPQFIGKGIGKKFIEWSMKEYSQGCTRIISINWKRGNEIPMKKISEGFGMKLLCELPAYWKADSITKGYACPECGQPPCLCNAVLFFKSV